MPSKVKTYMMMIVWRVSAERAILADELLLVEGKDVRYEPQDDLDDIRT
jgi:hypothetical protein